MIPSATLYEREAGELFGVDFVGTPNTEHLLLPDDWPAWCLPAAQVIYRFREIQKAEGGVSRYGTHNMNPEKFIVPIGPQHPALKEPGHFEFTVDGEDGHQCHRPPGICPPRH